ncbi:MAG: hypothetical protein EZS28_017053 [Streblomastix strix]|uniref:Uncharacterized protein n=1 Tax=Streblomastix strix TaxID=222440 RepID=A0A5J4VXP2_9EUKA|nr:MAG: hypothetical protein EZS28_017053 [Streblomastix strix]
MGESTSADGLKVLPNEALAQFYKIILNSSYGTDGQNNEKFDRIYIKDKIHTMQRQLQPTFKSTRKIDNDCYLVSESPELVHFCCMDTDSMYLAVTGSTTEGLVGRLILAQHQSSIFLAYKLMGYSLFQPIRPKWDTSKNTSEDTSKDTSEDTIENTTKNTSEKTSEDTFEDTLEEPSKYTSEDTLEDTSKDTSEDTLEDTLEDAIAEFDESIIQ